MLDVGEDVWCGDVLLALRSGENGRSDLMLRAVGADDIVEPVRVDDVLGSDGHSRSGLTLAVPDVNGSA